MDELVLIKLVLIAVFLFFISLIAFNVLAMVDKKHVTWCSFLLVALILYAFEFGKMVGVDDEIIRCNKQRQQDIKHCSDSYEKFLDKILTKIGTKKQLKQGIY